MAANCFFMINVYAPPLQNCETAINHKQACAPQAPSLPDLRKPKMIFINADVFRTMLVKQSETRASALSDVGALSMILPATSCVRTSHQTPRNEVGSCFRVKQQVSDFQQFHVQMLISTAGGGLDHFYKTLGERCRNEVPLTG